MSIVFSFLLGLGIGLVGAWFIWRNNQKKWESIRSKYEKAGAVYDTIAKEYFKKKD